MIRSILYKELRQHWWAFLLIGLICGLGYLGQIATAVMTNSAGSAFATLANFGLYISFAAIVLGNRS